MKYLKYTVYSYEILQELNKVSKEDSLEELKKWINENIKKGLFEKLKSRIGNFKKKKMKDISKRES